MKTAAEIKKALELCAKTEHNCEDCPYNDGLENWLRNFGQNNHVCSDEMSIDALKYIKILEENQPERGRWEKFDDNDMLLSCSVCHFPLVAKVWVDVQTWTYCPFCGARLEK